MYVVLANLYRVNNRSGYKGVNLDPRTGRYNVRIKDNGVVHHLANVDCPLEGSRIYIAEANRRFGEFATTGTKQDNDLLNT